MSQVVVRETSFNLLTSLKEFQMTVLTWIFVGVVTGVSAGLIMSGGKQRKFGMEMFAGTVGAFLGSTFLAPRFDIQITNQPDFTFPILMIAIVGALVGLVFLYGLRRLRSVNR